MAIKYHLKKKAANVTWKSGHIYQFRYSHWHNDPRPLIIVMGLTSGFHSNTNHEHHYISGLNISYVPRTHRTRFARQWKNEMQKNNGRVELAWDRVQTDFPYLKHAVRRYWYKPGYMITDAKEIPIDQIEEAVVSTWSKDFSKKLKLDLARKFKRVQKKRRKTGGFMSKFMRDIFGGGK